MEKVQIVVEMEGGMSFELEAEEQEPVPFPIPEQCVGDEAYYLFARRLIKGPTQFLDVHEDEPPQVVLDHPGQAWEPSFRRETIENPLGYSLGHGLSPEELNHCVQQFSNFINDLFDAHSSYNIDDDKIRFFVFKIERRGFWTSPYLSRASARSSYSETVIRSCPIYVRGPWRGNYFVEDDDGKCSICSGGVGRGTEAARLDCGHYFHCGCISRWTFLNYKCPCCPFRLVPTFIDPPRCVLYPPSGVSLDALLKD